VSEKILSFDTAGLGVVASLDADEIFIGSCSILTSFDSKSYVYESYNKAYIYLKILMF